MKQFKLNYLLGLGLVVGMLASCAPESIEPDNDGNADGKYTLNYAVQVIPVGDVSRGLNGASVTLQTQNGITTKSVGSDGIAVFENINAGTISGYVSAPGYASINFKSTAAFNNVDVNSQGYVTSTVYLIATNGEVEGRLYADWDQDGNTTITDPGNFQAVNLMVKYGIGAAYPMGAGDGALTQVSLDYTTYASATDANGFYTISNLPNTEMAYLTATLRMENVSLPSVAVPQAQVTWSWGPWGLSLMPGETMQWGDIYIP